MGNKGENIGDGGGWSRRFGPTMPHIRGSGRGSGQNPQRPGVRNLGDLARILEGPGGSKVSLFDSAVFGHCWLGDYRFSHFLFATLCDLCGIVVCLFVADSIGNVILIHTHMTLM